MRRVYGDRFWYARDYTLVPGQTFLRGEDIEDNLFIYLPALGEIEPRDLAFYERAGYTIMNGSWDDINL